MAKGAQVVSVRNLGVQALWLALGLLFLVTGLQMLTAYGAAQVRPYAGSSPLLGWAYRLLGARGACAFFALVEVPVGLGLLAGLVRPGGWPARLGAVGAALVALVTASFLLTAPGVLAWVNRLPLLSRDVGQFYVKDIALFAAALVLVGESRGRR